MTVKAKMALAMFKEARAATVTGTATVDACNAMTIAALKAMRVPSKGIATRFSTADIGLFQAVVDAILAEEPA